MRNSARAIVVALLALLSSMVVGASVTTSTTLQLQLLASSWALKGAQVPVFNIESDQSIKDLALQYGDGTAIVTPVPGHRSGQGGGLPGQLAAILARRFLQ